MVLRVYLRIMAAFQLLIEQKLILLQQSKAVDKFIKTDFFLAQTKEDIVICSTIIHVVPACGTRCRAGTFKLFSTFQRKFVNIIQGFGQLVESLRLQYNPG